MAGGALILALWGTPAAAQAITLSVTVAGAPSAPVTQERISLGRVSTQSGQPLVGRRVRTDGGAHFVVPLVARVQVDDRPAASRPGSTLRTVGPRHLQARPRTLRLDATVPDVEVLVRTQGLGQLDGSIRLGVGRSTPWHLGPQQGVELSPVDSILGWGATEVELVHEISAWLPDTAWGPQREAVLYTVAPR